MTVNARDDIVAPGWVRVVDGTIEEVSARALAARVGEDVIEAG